MQVRRPGTALVIILAAAGLFAQGTIGLLARRGISKPSTNRTDKTAQTIDRISAESKARDDYRKLKNALAEREIAKLEGTPSNDREIGLLQAKIAAAERAGLHPQAQVPHGAGFGGLGGLRVSEIPVGRGPGEMMAGKPDAERAAHRRLKTEHSRSSSDESGVAGRGV
jgi:hypothetical protein